VTAQLLRKPVAEVNVVVDPQSDDQTHQERGQQGQGHVQQVHAPDDEAGNQRDRDDRHGPSVALPSLNR